MTFIFVATQSPDTTTGSGTVGDTLKTTTSEQGLTSAGQTTTATPLICTEKEYIEDLVSTNVIRIRPNDDLNTQDLVTTGLNIPDETSTFKIVLPEGGLIVRDVKISSLNIIKVEVVFIPESGAEPKTIQGVPTSLPVNEFPTERISEILIKVLQISDTGSLKQVKLSIIACAETFTTTSARKFYYHFYFS